MGRGNLGFALKHPDLEVVALCDGTSGTERYGGEVFGPISPPRPKTSEDLANQLMKLPMLN